MAIEEMDSDGYEGHGGGDYGLIAQLPELLEEEKNDFIEGHRIGFAAALAAKEKRTVSLG